MNTIASAGYTIASTALGIVAMAILVVLLISRELMRAHGGKRSRTAAAFLIIPIAPLLLVVGVITLQRLGSIYSLSPANQGAQSSVNPPLGSAAHPHGDPVVGQSADAVVLVTAPRLHTIVVNPQTLRFGRQQVRASGATAVTAAAATIHIVNVAVTPLPISAVITGADQRDFVERDTCGGAARLGAYTGCTITVTFTPRHGGAHHATLVIDDTTPPAPSHAQPSGTQPAPTQTGPALGVQMLSPRTRPGGSARVAFSYAPYALLNIIVSYPGQGTVSFFDTTDDHGRLTVTVPVSRAIALHHGQATVQITVRAADGSRRAQATRTLTIVQGR